MSNPMQQIRVEKVTLNIGAGKDQGKLENGIKLLKNITGINPVKTFTQKRIPSWGLRPGLPIGCKITLRNKQAAEMVKKLLEAKDNILTENQFDDYGNIAFGIAEYIDIPAVKYDPKIGIIGLEVCITLQRPGFRIKRRRIKKRKVPKKHGIPKEESIDFMQKNFNVKTGEDE